MKFREEQLLPLEPQVALTTPRETIQDLEQAKPNPQTTYSMKFLSDNMGFCIRSLRAIKKSEQAVE